MTSPLQRSRRRRRWSDGERFRARGKICACNRRPRSLKSVKLLTVAVLYWIFSLKQAYACCGGTKQKTKSELATTRFSPAMNHTPQRMGKRFNRIAAGKDYGHSADGIPLRPFPSPFSRRQAKNTAFRDIPCLGRQQTKALTRRRICIRNLESFVSCCCSKTAAVVAAEHPAQPPA